MRIALNTTAIATNIEKLKRGGNINGVRPVVHVLHFLRSSVCLLLGAAFAIAAEPAGDQPVATVSGEPISTRQFVEALRRLRTRHADLALLRKAALEDCVRFAVIGQLAQQHELATDPTDAALRRAFAAENARRAEAKARGEVIYGPTQFGWEQFRTYWLDGVQRDLTRKLAARDGEESEALLRRFHGEQAKLFTAPGAAQPTPFAELSEHVRDEYRKANFQRTVREAIARARLRVNDDVLGSLGPNTPLE